jgi:hypothetical protein
MPEENIIEDDMIIGDVETPKPKLSPMMAAMILLAQTTSHQLMPEAKMTIITEENGNQYYWDPISQSYKKSLLQSKRRKNETRKSEARNSHR